MAQLKSRRTALVRSSTRSRSPLNPNADRTSRKEVEAKNQRKAHALSRTIADSDISDDEDLSMEEPLESKEKSKASSSAARSLASTAPAIRKRSSRVAVVLDKKSIALRGPSAERESTATSPSSVLSNSTGVGDQSSNYDTPGTSVTVTPVASLATGEFAMSADEVVASDARNNRVSRNKKVTMSARAEQLRNSNLSLSSSIKRRRLNDGIGSNFGEGHMEVEETSVNQSNDILSKSLAYTGRPKRRKPNTKIQMAQQGIDEQVALALEQEDEKLLDAEIALALARPENKLIEAKIAFELSKPGGQLSDSSSLSSEDEYLLNSAFDTDCSTESAVARRIKKRSGRSLAAMKASKFNVIDKKRHLSSRRNRTGPAIASRQPVPVDFDSDTSDDAPLKSRRASKSGKLSGKGGQLSSGLSSVSDILTSESDGKDSVSKPKLPARKGFKPSRGSNRMDREREKLVWQHPEVLTMWSDLEKEPKITPKLAKQPTSINRELKPFQLTGLNWMIEQEKTKWKGGLLGDEMGMGKTIQAVSLIMSDFPAKNPTMVVVPPVALMQWQSEIADYTNGALKVLVYHGTNAKVKGLSQKELMKYNVIMISYSGLESMYRKEQKGWSRKDEYGDAVLVKQDSVMHSIHWHRIILDEAHNIKSRSAGVSKACFAMKADYKWCLSGTPLQNRIGEFFSLMRFLEVKPFACYMCKSCSCTQLSWTLDFKTKTCDKCSHGGFSHVSIFNHELLDPIQQFGHQGPGKEAFDKLKILTDRIMLRRMKRDHTTAMELPPKDVTINNQFFGEEEHDFASSIMSNTNRQFETYVARGVMLNNYANIFGLIMQMRQIADHPDLILKKFAEAGQNVLVCVICDEPAEDAIRSGCRHDFCRRCVKGFIRSFDGSETVPDCPRCHIVLSIDLEQPEKEQDESAVKKSSIINRIKMENWTSSSKIELLVYELYKLRATGRTHKSIVFSQFTSMLQLVEWRLHRAGFNTVMLDGTMSPAQRQSSIKYFMETVDVEVFLVSLKAGGVALNLTEASRVFIVDPWWNPAAEWQSADRCHRIGQHRPCHITRLCIEDSVESRMVLLQEKKANMINSTINADDSAMQNLTPQDLQFLFRGS